MKARLFGKPEYGANIGPLLLALIPALFFGWRALEDEKSFLPVSAYRMLYAWLIWAAVAHIQMSFLTPGIIMACSLSGSAGAAGLIRRSLRFAQVRAQNLLSALVILSLALAAIGKGYPCGAQPAAGLDGLPVYCGLRAE
jgi:hypothetical protein